MTRRKLLLLLGGAMTASRVVRAQQKAMPMIGSLHAASPGSFAPYTDAFHRGLDDAGYVEGQNVAIEYRWAEGHPDRLPALADLVSRKVDVIAAQGVAAAVASRNATATIPIVFGVGSDPVSDGLVASLARPGGNLTGISLMTGELMPKRLELLFGLVPDASVMALLINPNSANPNAERTMREMQDAASTKRLELPILKASTASEIDGAFATLAQLHVGGIVLGPDPFLNSRREHIVALAARYAVPTIYEWREFAMAGGLISYGTSLSGIYRLAGTYVGRILSGAKPADLPVQQPTRFELVLNLKRAAALGLTIPPSIPARADEVIE